MKKNTNIRVYAWVEFGIWLIIVAMLVFGIRYHQQQSLKQYKHYQIFMSDVDGLIVGSPVKFLGVQIGYIKQIQIISNEVYIRFVITQKDLVLPVGSIATVEFSGLGGSKALEIYPPDKENVTDKIIAVKEPTRLNKVMGLFDEIFRDLDSIFTTVGYASNQLVKDPSEFAIPENVITPVVPMDNLIKLDKSVDWIMKIKQKFTKHLQAPQQKKQEEEVEGEE